MRISNRIKQVANTEGAMEENVPSFHEVPFVRPPLTLEDWSRRDLASPDYLLGAMLSTTNRMMISAGTGLGKTLLALGLGIRVAAGEGFLHWAGNKPRKVLYLDGEMSKRLLKARLEAEVQRLGNAPIGFHALCAEDMEAFKPLNTEAGRAMIWRIIEEIGGVDLIIFDNVMSLISGSMIDEEPWAEVLPFVRSLTLKEIGQIWIHHTGHDEGRSYGTKTREWQLDTVCLLEQAKRPDTDVSFKMSFRKARERTPANRSDFQDVEIALVDDCWTYTPLEVARRPAKVSPTAEKFLVALTNVIASDDANTLPGGRRAAAAVDWKTECVRAGLIEAAKPASARSIFSKNRRDLVAAGLTLGDYFRSRHFAPRLLTDYLAPMGAAIWSAPVSEMLDFPAENFVAFFSNHRLLQYDRPVWRTVKGGSQRYVAKLTAAFADRLRLGCAVTAVERTPHGVIVHDSHGGRDSYDHVVIAAHSDQALAMLSDADQRERHLLSAIGYAPNTVYLHRDRRLMPARRRAWASWNFLRWQRHDSVDNDVAVTYWMNQLQGIDPDKPLFVSLNPPFAPAPELTFGTYRCEHPQFNAAAFAAQKRLDEIQGLRHTWFCGAWTGYGFHEDGLRSGLAVAQALGAGVPWREPSPELAEAAE